MARTGWLSDRIIWLSGISDHGAGRLISEWNRLLWVNMTLHKPMVWEFWHASQNSENDRNSKPSNYANLMYGFICTLTVTMLMTTDAGFPIWMHFYSRTAFYLRTNCSLNLTPLHACHTFILNANHTGLFHIELNKDSGVSGSTVKRR